MLVSELTENLASRRETIVTVPMTDISVDAMASSVTVADTAYPLDEVAEKALAKSLGIPAAYLKSCPSTFKSSTLRFWLDENAEAEVSVFTHDNRVTAVSSPDLVTITPQAVGQVITRLFAPDDTVNLYRGSDTYQFDVVSQSHQVEVPNPDKIRFRPEVGDITHGGIRILMHPYAAKPPSAMSYFERYVCTNGMCTEEKLGRVTLQGNTAFEIIAELEAKAQQLLGGLDEGLEAYAATARKPVPGTLQAFAHQLAREYGLSRALLDEVMIIINQLGENATVYDVNQAFTTVAHRVESTATKHKLQNLGGALALESDKMIRRCTSCERLI
jgi:hypothetical protein